MTLSSPLSEKLLGPDGYGWIGSAEDEVREAFRRIGVLLGEEWEGLDLMVDGSGRSMNHVCTDVGRFMKYIGITGEALEYGLLIDELVSCAWQARRNLHREGTTWTR